MLYRLEMGPLVASRRKDGGFTLIEMAISIVIIGIIFSGTIVFAARYFQTQKIDITRKRLDTIANALSVYAQTHYRLPCPADPGAAAGKKGVEGSSGQCFTSGQTAAQIYSATVGIVPWKTLGIPEESVVDGWNRYITYKPAPNLTMNMLSADLQDKTGKHDNDIHNACRGKRWYDEGGNHINRAKALFCCNASPNSDYLGSSAPAGWRKSGVLTTSDAKAVAASATNGLPDAATVVLANNWRDDNIEASNSSGASNVANTSGDFSKPNLTYRDSPLIRATGNAVTLISHGGNGAFSFLFGQDSTNRHGGTLTASGNGTATGADAERKNVWPPQMFAGVIGIPKTSDGTYDLRGLLSGASDDIVLYQRSDQLFGKAGNASCQNLPPVGLPYNCRAQKISNTEKMLKSGNNGKPVLAKMYGLALEDVGKYQIQSSFTRLSQEAGYDNSVGLYTISADGTIENAQIAIKGANSMPEGQTVVNNANDVDNTSVGVGIFILANGNNTNDLSKVGTENTALKFYYDYGKSSQRPAKITDTSPPTLVLETTLTNGSVSRKVLKGEAGANAYHMYSGLNDNRVARTLRADKIDENTAIQTVGVSADGNALTVGFEDLPTINCYYRKEDGKCVSAKDAPIDKRQIDEYGGYIADIGDNDYDDADFTFSLLACPEDSKTKK